MPTLLGIDVSHHNAIPDFARLKAAGVGFVIAKITEGTSFVDPNFPASRAGCHAEGLVFGGYAYAHLGDPHAEARFFLDTMRPQPGEIVAEDLEVAVTGVDPVGWTATWSTDVHAALNCWPLLYGNQSEFGSHNWAPIIALGDGQWLAKYDRVPTGTPVGGWPVLAVKQYTDAGAIPGEAGQVDADAFQGDLATLLRYAVPAPTPGGDMPLNDADVTKLYWGTPFRGIENFAQVIDAIQDTANANSAKIDALAARPPVVIDQAAADLIAASLVANPTFQQVVASAAAAVVTQMDADLAKRFGPA